MEPSDLTPELRELEQRLAARQRPQPPADLKRRVLTAVRRELAAQPAAARWEQRRIWQYAAAAAAGILLVLNLAMSMDNHSNFPAPRVANGADVQQVAAKIRELVPFMTPQDAMREAITLRAGSHLEMVPQPRPGVSSLQALQQIEEGSSWVTQ